LHDGADPQRLIFTSEDMSEHLLLRNEDKCKP